MTTIFLAFSIQHQFDAEGLIREQHADPECKDSIERSRHNQPLSDGYDIRLHQFGSRISYTTFMILLWAVTQGFCVLTSGFQRFSFGKG